MRLFIFRAAHRFLVALGLLSLIHAQAGQFAVQPTRLELGPLHRSGALVIRNEASAPLSFQVTGVAWTQDENGQEQYTDTTDIVYFPRLLTVAPGQDAVIRVGLRKAPEALEKTYRVFIQELAPAEKSTEPGARIRVVMRFGAPVFVKPVREHQQLTLLGMDITGGQARWEVRNDGTAHEAFRAIALRGLDAQGAEVFRHDLSGHYLLAGDMRRFQATIAPEACGRLDRLTLAIKTHKSEATQSIAVGAAQCR